MYVIQMAEELLNHLLKNNDLQTADVSEILAEDVDRARKRWLGIIDKLRLQAQVS